MISGQPCFFAAFLVCSLFCSVLATYGTDVSQLTSVDAFTCLKKNGYSFTIVRAYQNGGHTDPNAVQSIKNAWAGGQSHVDAYIFPCVAACANTISAGQQIQATHNFLSGTKYGMLWLDIEGSQYWYSDTAKNVNFIQELVNESKALNITLGIYSSNSQWTPITGSSKAFSTLPIWYAHYENTPNPSYSDWAPFGGWMKPAIKQFKGTTSICGASVDENFY